ncbi:dihydropteroate synthase [Wenxinia marina]|uniref:Dihydropteroate synthase n=1 Tax=Wenxinia marina DSM 24838 TaxID=1123501 RepID=A0A0D0NLU1_9RHOB|nr:dihydropteroate synthase [Wenxinia marina]KIQ69225.1 Dihydropteroate synthase [Wenxinia marina DSM 24838]GGL71266.1 dihydropteroate synthase [Wenxinia marina]
MIPLAGSGPRPPAALPLAGSRLAWFDRVLDGETVTDAADLPAALRDRLFRQRPGLCGLTLDRPRIMGILNVTPDSFSDGGDLTAPAALIARARAMAAHADILDIGGESTRPGAAEVPEADEIARTVPAIRAIRAEGITTPISIDTRKARVAAAALAAGADMVNDVAAMTYDADMARVVAEHRVPVCLMHAKGDPATMQRDPTYADVVAEVADWLARRLDAADAAGIAAERVILDPGIGFGKTLQHNVSLLRHLAGYHALGPAILLGASRKRFIGTLGNAPEPRDRTAGSVAVALWGIAQGVQIVRVHDTMETRQAISLHEAVSGVGQDDA